MQPTFEFNKRKREIKVSAEDSLTKLELALLASEYLQSEGAVDAMLSDIEGVDLVYKDGITSCSFRVRSMVLASTDEEFREGADVGK